MPLRFVFFASQHPALHKIRSLCTLNQQGPQQKFKESMATIKNCDEPGRKPGQFEVFGCF
jgi:hypothetical protein